VKTLEDMAEAAEKLRLEMLFDDCDVTHNLKGLTEQHFLAALAHLEIAVRELKIAALHKR
jgi:hypothetical protein